MKAHFKNPPREYSTGPLWVWNDRVTRTEIDEQLADFKARGIGGAFVFGLLRAGGYYARASCSSSPASPRLSS